MVAQWLMNPTSIHEDVDLIPGLSQWGGGESGLASALVWASSCSSDLTPTLGISICYGCSPKNEDKKERITMTTLLRKKNGEDIPY